MKDDNDELRARFEVWRDSLPATHWAKSDLSACWEGWQACHAALLERQASAVPVCWSLRHANGTGALFADCIYENEDDAYNDAIALNGEHGKLIAVPLFTHPPAQASAAPVGSGEYKTMADTVRLADKARWPDDEGVVWVPETCYTTAIAEIQRLEALLYPEFAAPQPLKDTRCPACVIHPEPSPPGPCNPPIWCCLPEGHGGPHRHNGGGMYPSIPFRDTDKVSMEPLTPQPPKAQT